MRFNYDPQSAAQIIKALHTNGFSHQPRNAITPFVVESFDHAGFAAAFARRAMLPRAKEASVGFIKVAVNQLATVAGRNRKPQFLQRLFATISDTPRHNLMGQSRNHQPQIAITSLETITNHQLVEFERVTRNSGQKRVGKTQAAGLGLFLSTRRMVARPQLKVRAIARCDTRSCKAFSINASFSALRCRPGPSSVHVLRHALQRNRCRAPSVKPKRTTPSLPWQCGHT